MVVPHIVRSQELDQANLRVIDTGPGQGSVELRHEDNGSSTVAPAAHPTANQHAVVGSIPAQSALEAAPQMLALLRSDMAANGSPAAAAQATAPSPGPPGQSGAQPATGRSCGSSADGSSAGLCAPDTGYRACGAIRFTRGAGRCTCNTGGEHHSGSECS